VRVGDSENSQRQDGENAREHDETSRLRIERKARMFDLLSSVTSTSGPLYIFLPALPRRGVAK